MLQPVGEHPKGKRLCSGTGLPPGGAIGQHTWQRRYFSDPPPVLFSLDLDVKRHGVPPDRTRVLALVTPRSSILLPELA
jgi:hypothetical protein